MNKILPLLAVLALTASCCGSKPEKRVHKLLMDRMLTLSVAESCTGGDIASRFTAIPRPISKAARSPTGTKPKPCC